MHGMRRRDDGAVAIIAAVAFLPLCLMLAIVVLADRFDERADVAPDPSVALDLVTEPEILCHLDGDHRRLVVLRYVDGWPTKDIARQVGKSDEAVRAAIFRSLQTLRRSDT